MPRDQLFELKVLFLEHDLKVSLEEIPANITVPAYWILLPNPPLPKAILC